MTVDKLSRFLPALGQSAQNSTNATKTPVGEDAPTTRAAEAVELAGNFGVGDSGDNGAKRARVEELKQAVAAGSYKPDTTKVAEAVVRELFA